MLHPAFFGDVCIEFQKQFRQFPISFIWSPEKNEQLILEFKSSKKFEVIRKWNGISKL